MALLSLGPGNVKDVTDIARGLIEELRAHGFTIAWVRAPISVRDTALPGDVVPLSVYPLVRYMRAFDVFAGAAGYNTCCEVVQASVPSLLVPNTLLADDQARRAEMMASHAPVVVSPCRSAGERTHDAAAAIRIGGAFSARYAATGSVVASPGGAKKPVTWYPHEG